jgi:hypothetical protein
LGASTFSTPDAGRRDVLLREAVCHVAVIALAKSAESLALQKSSGAAFHDCRHESLDDLCRH